MVQVRHLWVVAVSNWKGSRIIVVIVFVRSYLQTIEYYKLQNTVLIDYYYKFKNVVLLKELFQDRLVLNIISETS